MYSLKGQLASVAVELANRIGATPENGEDELARARRACRGRKLLMVIEGAEEEAKDSPYTLKDLLAVLDDSSMALVLTRDLAQADPAELVRLDHQLRESEAAQMLDSWLGESSVTREQRHRVLRLANGHPLVLTWAGGLLALGDEPAGLLLDDWESSELPAVNNPQRREHDLTWLFERSVRRLDEDTRQVLAAMGALAHASVNLELISYVLSEVTDNNAMQRVRAALRRCVQLQLLRHDSDEDDLSIWKFSHVLAYSFVRAQLVSSTSSHVRMGDYLTQRLRTALTHPIDRQQTVAFAMQLHANALMGYPSSPVADTSGSAKFFYESLIAPTVLEFAERWQDTGFSDQCQVALQSAKGWLQRAQPRDTIFRLFAPDLTRALIICHNKIGGVRLAIGDLSGALAAYSESLCIAQHLVQAEPSNTAWHGALTLSLRSIGEVREAQGDLRGALDAFSESLRICQRFAESDPSNTQWQRDLSFSHSAIGAVRQAQGDLPGALGAFAKGLRIREQLVQIDPSNTQWQRDLSLSHERIGAVRRAQGDLLGALDAFAEGLQIAHRLAQIDPSNAEWQRDLSISHNKIGAVRQAQGDLPGALGAFAEGLRIRERLVQIDPSNTQWQRDLGLSHESIGAVRQAQGDLPGALDAFAEGLQIAHRLAQIDPSNAEWPRDLSISHNKIGAVRDAQGDPPGAMGAFVEGLRIRERLVQIDPSNAEWQRDLSISHDKIGAVRQAQGDLPGALEAYAEGLQIAQRLAQIDPRNTQWQRDIRVSHSQIGAVRQAQGDLRGALDAFSECLRICQRLAESDPSNAEWQRDLSVSHNLIGAVRQAQGDLPS
jgi:tetratricopeptide (TPR) repeat protein